MTKKKAEKQLDMFGAGPRPAKRPSSPRMKFADAPVKDDRKWTAGDVPVVGSTCWIFCERTGKTARATLLGLGMSGRGNPRLRAGDPPLTLDVCIVRKKATRGDSVEGTIPGLGSSWRVERHFAAALERMMKS